VKPLKTQLPGAIKEFIAPFAAAVGYVAGFHTRWRQDLEKMAGDQSVVVNLQRVNGIEGINLFFRPVNRKLKRGGRFVGCLETLDGRKGRLFSKYPPVLNVAYYAADFLLKRVCPNLSLTRKIYFKLTHGRNRALSKAEILGRLVYCGFSIE